MENENKDVTEETKKENKEEIKETTKEATKEETKESKVPIWPFIAGGVVLSAVAAVITFVIHKKHSLKEKPEGEE